jgi:hypothetical protein
MKLHRINYTITDKEHEGVLIHMQAFEASDGAASKRMTEIKTTLKAELDDKPTREAVEIPTDKTGLLEWLNANAMITSVVFE